ncbi:hypothetical protein BDV95DRAFT_607856 [Massariosphaeria phaeospora]|uniref:FHA domain-containing protein n=1 Tax=Massariosphaeria phaeospora TaxID=100035 RepID=A0A7C8M7D8_9PLEO|nr:hypothetical protein BDV95DRAFT_607856 [Massariosphaeria phaeospora]
MASPLEKRAIPMSSDAAGLQEQTRKPSLLPAFEPLSSSPFPARPPSSKRKFGEESPSYSKQLFKHYPTPVPTSSTGIMPFSSPRNDRPCLNRTVSTLSERVPLGGIPSVDLPADGSIVRMGRSSNSSDFQLPANRLISRVHVQAAYHAPDPHYPLGRVEIECLGWNGAKIHCGSHIFEIGKGDTYMSQNPSAEIMLDVQDTRVTIAWPAIPTKSSWDSDDEDTAPTPTRCLAQDPFASSPPMVPRSPVSQSPIRQPVFAGLGPVTQSLGGPVKVFEDNDSAEEDQPKVRSPSPLEATFILPDDSLSLAVESPVQEPKASILSSFAADDFSDEDEENDPIVHSFGPFGENLLPRLASFTTATPTQSSGSAQRRRQPLSSAQSPQQSSLCGVVFKESPIKNHVINQLAYSRIHSQPLSIIHSNLPAELRACAAKADVTESKDKDKDRSGTTTPTPQLTKPELKKMMDAIPCVGEIPRSGKDAAGKPLENEFYYVPEMDTDQMRRDTVTGGMRGTGLRAVRKSHKQYYWKRPRV